MKIIYLLYLLLGIIVLTFGQILLYKIRKQKEKKSEEIETVKITKDYIDDFIKEIEKRSAEK